MFGLGTVDPSPPSARTAKFTAKSGLVALSITPRGESDYIKLVSANQLGFLALGQAVENSTLSGSVATRIMSMAKRISTVCLLAFD